MSPLVKAQFTCWVTRMQIVSSWLDCILVPSALEDNISDLVQKTAMSSLVLSSCSGLFQVGTKRHSDLRICG